MPPENLPAHAKEIFEAAEAAARRSTCKDVNEQQDECVARVAWSAVKEKFKQTKDGQWIPKAETFSLVIQKASFDKVTQQRRWIAVASDTEEDSRKDSMTLELFNDFVSRIDSKEVPPGEFNVTSDYWSGGLPYLSLSHLLDLDGKGVPGPIDAVFVDGNKFKSKGRFNDTPLGRACFDAVCADLYGEDTPEDKVRISIAFLDYKHRHKESGYTFEGKSVADICPECIADTIKMMIGQDEEVKGREFLRGHLIHEALTRVPVNNRTSMEVLSMTDKPITQKEDIASIAGDELADELEKLVTQKVQSESLVIKAHKSDKEDDEEDEDEDEKKKSKSKKQKKSDTVNPETVLNTMFDELKELKSLIVTSEETHPLDEAITTLKSEYTEAIALDLTSDEKLQLIQKSYAELGDIIQTGVANIPATPGSDAQVLANAISKAFLPISEKLDLLLTQAASPQAPAQVPVRRSYQQSPLSENLMRKAPETKSTTPNLRALIEKTV